MTTRKSKAEKSWTPTLSEKQKELLRLCRKPTDSPKYIGVFGTRWSGKSIGCQHAIADHLWNTKGASVLVMCYTQGSAATSGIWNELTEKTIPEWIGAGIGMEWEVEPKVHGATKKMLCSVTNKFGGVSKLELDTLDDEREVEKKYKSRYYSMIYWSEASDFNSPLSMMTLINALRVRDLPKGEHIMLIDANPPDSGSNHFLYEFFFELRCAREVDDEVKKSIQKCLHLTEWTMADNPFLSEDEKNRVKGSYMSDPRLYRRYILGEWIKTPTRANLFADVFSYAKHCVGSREDKDPDILMPDDNCTELLCGYDPGSTNPVSYIIEEIPMKIVEAGIGGKEKVRHVKAFKFLDEVESIGKRILVSEITKRHVEKMKFWESVIGKPVNWRHYSDSGAMQPTKEGMVDRSVADEVFVASEGMIKLIGVEKGIGSVVARIRLWRKLLVEGRILISAIRCPKLVQMCENIKTQKDDMFSIHKQSVDKHPFDAATYPLQKVCYEELQDLVSNTKAQAKTAAESSLVFIRL